MVINGDPIMSQNNVVRTSIPNVHMSRFTSDLTSTPSSPSSHHEDVCLVNDSDDTINWNINMNSIIECPTKQDCYHLSETLPGLNGGKMNSLCHGLYHHINQK